MVTLNYIGDTTYTSYKVVRTVQEFLKWVKPLKIFQFDVETNMVDSIANRELRVIQFGNKEGTETWVIQWSFLTKEERVAVLSPVNDRSKKKIIQNCDFEYQMMLKQGIRIDNIHDTMVAEQVLYTGWPDEKGFYALTGLVSRYCQLDISKASQCSFGDDILTDEKINYAATDVLFLGSIMDQQLVKIKANGLKRYLWMDIEASLAASDMSFEGCFVDPIKWHKNIDLAQPIVDKAKSDLNSYLIKNHREWAYDNGFMNREEECSLKASNTAYLLNLLLPEEHQMTSYNKLALAAKLAELDPDFPEKLKGKPNSKAAKEYNTQMLAAENAPDHLTALRGFYLGYTEGVIESFAKEPKYYDCLVKDGFIRPKDTFSLLWSSPAQRLKALQLVIPDLESTNKKFLEDYEYLELIGIYFNYTSANALITKFGIKFLNEQVKVDGKVHPRYNIVLNTGRMSASGPNIMQIPAKALPDGRENDYRNCFVTYPDYKFVDADYISQELANIAVFANEPVWLDALAKGKDLHSICAALMFPDWETLAEEGCAFYKLDDSGTAINQKCKCKGHKKLRDYSKTLNFGLSYGMSAVAAAAKLKVTVPKAQEIIDIFFATFSKIKAALDDWGDFGAKNGYIQNPLGRKRFFDYWTPEVALQQTYDAKKKYGKIKRASCNFPIQSAGADMLKIAMILCRRFIWNNGLYNKIKPIFPVHDQLTCIAHDDYVDFWNDKLKVIMEFAAKLVLRNDLLKADPQVTDKWSK